MATEDELALAAAGAALGAHSANPWTRHAREDLQGSHSLTTPLARWARELVEAPPLDAPDAGPGTGEPDIAIPEAVLHARPPLRLPEDAVCRSPIAGLVIAVLATAGELVTRRQPVMVIEAMKMQNNVSPEADGVLKAIHVSPGDAVKAGQVLFELM
jgi:biotin carboxyl carrier protein